MENLQFGALFREEERAFEEQRCLKICERLQIPLEAVKLILTGERAVWRERLSRSEQVLLNIARAFAANPEVLVLHKPTSLLDDKLALNTLNLLREFVDKKGIEMSDEEFIYRRPRTCVLTTSRMEGVHVADKVFQVSHRYVAEVAPEDVSMKL